MKHYFPMGRKIEMAQRADRNKPTLAPEMEYCLPGSRFALMMRLARMGASDRVFRRRVPGIDRWTISVLRKLVAQERGETSTITPMEDDGPGVMAG